jgi:hypothetical protein
MHIRVVRFNEVDPDRVEKLLSEIDERGEPPASGIKATKLQILLDRDQRTSVVLQYFDSEQDMRDSEQGFDSMDASETPGSRASVDRCELLREFEVPAS